jgi:hypothetical protein
MATKRPAKKSRKVSDITKAKRAVKRTGRKVRKAVIKAEEALMGVVSKVKRKAAARKGARTRAANAAKKKAAKKK